MKPIYNKPRVFLSHSAKDKSFIEKLYRDLRKCQIEPWLDTEEIRDGKSWLKMIFEDGIPTCDAVLVYFTENSILSPMVAKEIDAALIQSLSQYGVSFLPYVENAELRDTLRIDLRSLHCREWNRKNYTTILPSVVSEIWRSHMEKSIEAVSLKVRNKTLELELELTRLKQSKITVFEDSEDREFSFLIKKLDRKETFEAHLYAKEGALPSLIRTDIYQIVLINLLIDYVKSGRIFFETHDLDWELTDKLKMSPLCKKKIAAGQNYSGAKLDPYLHVELKTYGLIRGVNRTKNDGRSKHIDEISEKFYRFIYWCEFNGITNVDVQFEYVGTKAPD